MKFTFMYANLVAVLVLCFAMVAIAETITTTTTNADGSTTTVVEEKTAGEEQVAAPSTPKIVGPTGATGTIRRSHRRQGRRGDVHIQ